MVIKRYIEDLYYLKIYSIDIIEGNNSKYINNLSEDEVKDKVDSIVGNQILGLKLSDGII